MKIDGLNQSYYVQRESKAETAPAAAEAGVPKTVQAPEAQGKKNTGTDTESYVEIAHKSRQELSISEKDWIELIEKANKAIIGANKTFEYSIHEQTKQIMVKVIDQDTKEVIREIPPEKILDMVAKMWEMAGIIVDERR